MSTATSILPLPSDQDASGRTLAAAEIELLIKAIHSGTLTSTKGTFVKQLETGFAHRMGCKHVLACSHGSAAIHGAVAAVNYATMMKRDYWVNIVATSNSWGG